MALNLSFGDMGDEEERQLTPDSEPTAQKRRPGRPRKTDLGPYKDLIVKLFCEENKSTIEISQKLSSELDLDVSNRTISRLLTVWKVPRKSTRGPTSQEFRSRLQFHWNRNLNDEEIGHALIAEGFDIKVKNLGRLRQKLGMRRRSRYPEYREFSKEGTRSTSQTNTTIPKKKGKDMANNAGLISKVTAYVEEYMSAYDGSHDYNHIKRVTGLAHKIYTETIVLGVSYSSEIKDPAAVQELIQKYPELAIVQDADRLDAIGAVGIGRTFTFGGAKGARNMGETIQHFDDKLERLEGMMKTEPGKRMARERTERLKIFKQWWEEEQTEAEGSLRPK
ncbi:HD domain-containing protein [Rutstroemia sp. NJR-2017a BBW]|nr:HD domain-containing protein [Rutstroemia sp. NJR-2017a BBW]